MLYSLGEEVKVSVVEVMGIKFKLKVICDGEIVDLYDCNCWVKWGLKQEKLDLILIGYVKKFKKKIKLGYKCCICKKISDKVWMDCCIE